MKKVDFYKVSVTEIEWDEDLSQETLAFLPEKCEVVVPSSDDSQMKNKVFHSLYDAYGHVAVACKLSFEPYDQPKLN